MSGSPHQLALEAQASDFAKDLAHTFSAFLGRDITFESTTTGSRVSVAPAEGSDLSVSVGDRKILSLAVSFRCEFDHRNDYLAIHTSDIKVFAGSRPNGEPLFRYDYVHSPKDHRPAAHIQVHAHRDQFTQAMTLAAVAGAKHRQLGKEDSFEVARMCTLHFPVGGARFRPCLEDVLHMIEIEFGATTGPEWAAARDTGREKFRRQQTGAVVRDCPSEAVRVLKQLGYKVEEPENGPTEDRVDRLRAF